VPLGSAFFEDAKKPIQIVLQVGWSSDPMKSLLVSKRRRLWSPKGDNDEPLSFYARFHFITPSHDCLPSSKWNWLMPSSCPPRLNDLCDDDVPARKANAQEATLPSEWIVDIPAFPSVPPVRTPLTMAREIGSKREREREKERERDREREREKGSWNIMLFEFLSLVAP